jgi:glycosyltransferase involved in cell wall biosynthesis
MAAVDEGRLTGVADGRRLHESPEMRPRLYLHYGHTLDPVDWERRHAAGLVPDRLPYGLNRLADSGLELAVRRVPSPTGLRRTASRLGRGLSGGFEPPELVHDRQARRSSGLVVCWDERAGVAATARSSLPGEPPVASGIIWLTDPGAAGGVRARAAARALARAECLWVNAAPQLDVLARWGVPPSRRHFVPMGVDAEFWQNDADPTPWFVVGGGNDRHRNHRLLVEAMRRVRERRPEARLELATHHPVDVPAELGRRHPRLDHRDMRDLYGRASVVVLAVHRNLHLSGLTTILETMASGRPVVATETPGMSDYVRHGETGLLVRDDVDALAAGVEELLREPERARELGRRGREVFEEGFTTGHLAAGLAALFDPLAR